MGLFDPVSYVERTPRGSRSPLPLSIPAFLVLRFVGKAEDSSYFIFVALGWVSHWVSVRKSRRVAEGVERLDVRLAQAPVPVPVPYPLVGRGWPLGVSVGLSLDCFWHTFASVVGLSLGSDLS